MRTVTITAGLALGALALAGCSNADPLGDGGGDGTEEIIVGSQAYYSNEIIAEIYAQALEAQDFTVDRQFQIGQREVYLPEIESGAIDVLPEYTGNLLQYYDDTATETDPAAVEEALAGALPEGVRSLTAAEANDQDSYNVTAEFAEENGLTTIADLANVDEDVTIAGNAELEDRPYGPDGLKEVYDVDATVTPVADSGGPLTVKALVDGDVNVADIYSADPSIEANDFVTLEDPENLILPNNVVPIVSDKVDESAAGVLDGVSEALTLDDLKALNAQSVNDQKGAEEIATGWLEEKGLN